MIKIVKIDEKVAVDQSGNRYLIADDIRGVNQKMWIKKEDGTIKDSYLIKFSTRKPDTLTDFNLYNEVVCSRICRELELDHVDYDFCEFVDTDGKSRKGVICPNYRESERHVELNGRSLHDFYCSWCYDNNFGKIPDIEINTVYAYIEQLKSRFESRKMLMSEETEKRMTEELITLSMFDFATCQIDRHWGNVGWINNNLFEDNRFRIKLLPIYDNECSFLLDEITEEDLINLIETIRSPKKSQIAIDMVNKKKRNAPYLGIKTALVRLKEDPKGFLVPRSNIEANVSNATILARELAQEINNRPVIKKLYDKLINLDMNKLMAELDCIPEDKSYLKEIYSFVWNTRIQLLKDSFEQTKNHPEGGKEDGSGLSLL